MLFAVIDLIELGRINDNKIYFNDELRNRFTFHFELLKSKNDQNNPYLPFYHLTSSGFWHLKLNDGSAGGFKPQRTLSEASIRKHVECAFLDDELFEYFRSASTRHILKENLTSNLDSLEDQFQRWGRSVGKSEKTLKNYAGALKSSIPSWLENAGLPCESLLSVSSFYEYENIVSQVSKVEEFVERDRVGKGMYSAAIRCYRDFLSDITQADMQRDIEDILQDQGIPETQKVNLVNTRIGQGKFREELISYWHGRCAVTGYRKLPFLIASHIKPWAQSTDQERLDPFNGILLLANLDKAFDLGFVSFKNSGRIMLSKQLEDHETLGIHADMKVSLCREHQLYMEFHRDCRFRN